MKKLFYFLAISIVLFATSCNKDDDDAYKTYPLNVELVYPTTGNYKAIEGVTVSLTNTANSKRVEAKTDASGIAKFTVTAGVYDAAATDNRTGDGVAFVLNGAKTGITITNTWTSTETVKLELTESKLSQVVIKEVMYGGTPKDDGSGAFMYDSYIVLYNNSDLPASLDNICFATTLPFNPHASNYDYIGGKLFYEAEGWVPAGVGIFHFNNKVTLEPRKQIVVAVANAVDNTKTYSKSINFANPEYYCMYDIEVFNHKLTYPSPSELIPSSHYLKAIKYGTGTAWVFSQLGPAFFIFSPEGQTKEAFGADASNINQYNNSSILLRKKVPVEWVIDGVEIFLQGQDSNKKRLNTVIDAGAVYGTNKLGYTIYRNVDKAATEAIEENKGKLVYNYAYGTADVEGGSTDPSGIDAEASIKNGAKIVYMDTNNSSNDFHQRKEASLRYN